MGQDATHTEEVHHSLTSLMVDGEDLLTEVVSAGAPARSARALVLVFPGNPGAPAFYATFVAALAARGAARGVRVACVGHASHSALTASARGLDLRAQLAHKLAFVRLALRESPAAARRGALVLVGHSVGAYMALEAAAELGVRPGPGPGPGATAGAIAGVAALFPTLEHIGETPRGRALAPLFTAPGLALVALLAWLLRRLAPEVLLRWFAGACVLPRGAGARAAAAAADLVHEHVARNALLLARHEMREIGAMRAAARSAARALGSRLLCYFAPGDGWNREGDAERTRAMFPLGRVVLCSGGHTHSFVMRPESVEAMAAEAWAAADRALAAADEGGGSGREGGGGVGGVGESARRRRASILS